MYINFNLYPLSNYAAAAEVPSLKISSHLSNGHEGHLNPYEDSHKLYEEKGFPFFESEEKKMKIETTK